MSDPATIAFYEAHAPRYATSGTEAPNRHLDPFLDRLAPGAAILELGCGAGRDAARMAERGFGVDPTDAAAAMVATAASGTACRRGKCGSRNCGRKTPMTPCGRTPS